MNNRQNGGEKIMRFSEEDRSNTIPQDYIAIILQSKIIVLSIWIAVFSMIALYTFMTKRVYQSSATILIDTKAKSGVMMTDLMGLESENNIRNELEILKSRSLSEIVAKKMIEKRFLDDSLHTPIRVIQFAEGVKGENEKLEAVAECLRGSVQFETMIDADVIKITTTSSYPEEAALLANLYAESYYERNLYTSRIKYSAARSFLAEQLKKRQEQLTNAEQALQKYMEGSGIVYLDEAAKQLIEQISKAEAARDALTVDIEATTQNLNAYQKELEMQEPEVARLIQSADDSYIRLIQEQLAKLEVSRDLTLSQKQQTTDQSQVDANLQETENQIRSLRSNLNKRTADFLRSGFPSDGGGRDGLSPASSLSKMKQMYFEAKVQLGGLKAKKAVLDSVVRKYDRNFESIPQKSIHFAQLQRTRLSEEKTYLLIEDKFNEASIAEQSQSGYLDIIDRAVASYTPVSPDVTKNLLMGFILGLGLGIGVVLLRDYLDTRIRKPDDLKKIGLPPLGVIMLMNEEISRLGGKLKIDVRGKMIDAHLITHTNPFSSIAEAYRQLRTNVQYARIDFPLRSINFPLRTILVTSPNPIEGKSTTVSNLSIAFAQAGKKVLAVDTDLRKPNLHIEFDLRQSPGITDVLFNTSELKAAIQQTVIKNLDLLCCGTIPSNPSELLGSTEMKTLIVTLKKKYDIVLFDSSPVLAVTDSSILSTLVDGVIVVTSAGQTSKNSLIRTIESLEGIRAHVLGVMLNNFDPHSSYGGYYGYRHYKYRYGTQEKKVEKV
ncbi:MAG: polysaccharide biosynthesis tyrosine autokinase [Bacteroidota bacterium]